MKTPLVHTFNFPGEFVSFDKAAQWLTREGYSLGRMQKGSPCGILHGDYDIQKWRNLRPNDRAALDGIMVGDFRNGPVTIKIDRFPAGGVKLPETVGTGSVDSQSPSPATPNGLAPNPSGHPL